MSKSAGVYETVCEKIKIYNKGYLLSNEAMEEE